jgi:hypothetical protein
MTSMEKLTGKKLEMESVKREVVRSFSRVFEVDVVEGVAPLPRALV